MHHYLYIDTSGPQSCTMIMNEEGVLGVRTNLGATNHAAYINLHINELLQELKLEMKQIETVLVLNGPGSYTGLRISLSIAKGICYAYDIPLCLLNKLDLIQTCSSLNQSICAVIKAREDEYFAGAYSEEGKLLENYQLCSKEEVINKVKIYNSTLCVEEQISTDFENARVVTINLEGIFNLGMNKIKSMEYADLLSSEPFYLKNVYINKINKL